MKSHTFYKHLLLLASGGLLLLLVSVVLAQNSITQIRDKRVAADEWNSWAKSFDMRVLVDKDPIRVLGAEKIREDLKCEIHLGSYLYPFFDTEGSHDRLKTAGISLDPWTSVSVIRRQTKDTSYTLYLFTEDEDGKIMALFDLDMNGVWDVKDCRKKHYIFFEKEWLEVDKICERDSEKPTAVKGEKCYEFQKSWKLTQKQ